MKVGILGFARSGKTTIFNSLTGAHAAVGAFGSRDANVAVIKVPDERIDKLAEIFNPKKKTYAEIEFIDIAPNESASDEKILDSAALNVLKNADALVHVVRSFDNEEVMHPLESIEPVRDCRALDDELQLIDLIIIEKRIERLEKESKKDSEHHALCRCKDHIETGQPLRTLDLSFNELKTLHGFTFLSLKPLMLLGNYGESCIGDEDPAGLQAYAQEKGQTLIELCGEMEMEVAELAEEERQVFRDDLGLGEESRTRFIQTAYDMLGLMSFLTAGDPEVRAWTIRKGTKAVDAAGVIHSDIQRGFIRAETVNYKDFIEWGSMVKAKEHGKVSLEGKEYIVHDGDIILFRFNV